MGDVSILAALTDAQNAIADLRGLGGEENF